jgi:HAD superfamily hydrolase (TIGR01549 family)
VRLPKPAGLLIDYGGTLVEEVGADPRAGLEALLALASYRPEHATLERVLERVERVTTDVAARRDRYQVETPWPALTRLIHDYFGTRFSRPMEELELAFWKASVVTTPMPGARDALDELHRLGFAMGVISNSSFGSSVIRYELAKHHLTEHLSFVMVSAEYAVRKPNPLLLETAAARLGVRPTRIWCVGDRLDTDVAGARASGMAAVLFGATPVDRSSADLVVDSWDELVQCLRDRIDH